MALYEDFLKITIDGTDLSDYVINYQRNESMCEPGAYFVLTMTRKKPDNSMLDIGISDDVVIEEKYGGGFDRTIKGFVTSVNIDAEKATMQVSGADKYILLADYFLDDREVTGGETVAYWIEEICGRAGLSVQFDADADTPTKGSGTEEGTPLGLQFALDSIKMLERRGSVYTRYDSDLDKVVVYRLDTSEPKVNINSTNLVNINRQTATESTRNVVKAWGGFRYDWLDGKTEQIFGSARIDMDELVVDKTTMIANPEIKTTTFANIVAQRVLSVTAELDDLIIAECAGLYPDVKIAEWANINISQGEFNYTRERQITSLAITVQNDGAKTTFTFGEKCPRISIFPPVTPIYVTTTKDGAGVSWDAGDSFVQSNIGLTTSGELHGKSIAVNNYGRQFLVTAAGLYKRYSSADTWTAITNMPEPTNESNDITPVTLSGLELIKVVDEPLRPYTFHVLTEGHHPSGWYRWYVYTTEDYGYNWKTTQMYAPASGPAYQEHPQAPSGLVFDVYTHDIISTMNNSVLALVTPSSELPEEEEEQDVSTIYTVRLESGNVKFYVTSGGGSTQVGNQYTNYGAGAKIWSCPTNRGIAYIGIIASDGNDSSYTGTYTYVVKTTDGGDNWTKIHEAELLADSSDAVPSRSISFDPSSNELEVRIAFTTWEHTLGNDQTTCYARFVSSNPNGSTSYSDTSKTIDLDLPDLSGDEFWDGYYFRDTGIYVDKNAATDNYTWSHQSFWGPIKVPGPSVVGRGMNTTVVRLVFGTETIEEFNQRVIRDSNTNSTTDCAMVSCDGSSAVYIANQEVYDDYRVTLSKVTSTAITTVKSETGAYSGRHSLVMAGFEQYSGTEPILVDDYYQYTSAIDGYMWDNAGIITITSDFLVKSMSTGATKQFSSSNRWWAFGENNNSNDFCYTEDGINWTTYWDGVGTTDVRDFAWRTFA